MKTFVSCITLILLALITVPAFSASNIQTKYVFNSQSSAISTTNTSGITDTGLNTKKTIVFNGVRSASTYGNYSGTFTLQCAPTASGPWMTAKDKSGNATTSTTPSMFHLDDMCRYVRSTYARAQRGAKAISAWLFYSE